MNHRFLQRMTISGACNEADLQAQLTRMVETGVFNHAEASVVDLVGLARFWEGDVGCEIRANAGVVRRELPFTTRFTPAELARIMGTPKVPELKGEFVVVQGVADLVVELESALWLLDFKTDDVSASDLTGHANLYRPQLDLYAAALAAIYGKPVQRRWLHFVRASETVVM